MAFDDAFDIRETPSRLLLGPRFNRDATFDVVTENVADGLLFRVRERAGGSLRRPVVRIVASRPHTVNPQMRVVRVRATSAKPRECGASGAPEAFAAPVIRTIRRLARLRSRSFVKERLLGGAKAPANHISCALWLTNCLQTAALRKGSAWGCGGGDNACCSPFTLC